MCSNVPNVIFNNKMVRSHADDGETLSEESVIATQILTS